MNYINEGVYLCVQRETDYGYTEEVVEWSLNWHEAYIGYVLTGKKVLNPSYGKLYSCYIVTYKAGKEVMQRVVTSFTKAIKMPKYTRERGEWFELVSIQKQDIPSRKHR